MTNLSAEDSEKVETAIPGIFFKWWIILPFFLLISVVDVAVFLRFNWLFGGQDLQFHLQRIDELYKNVEHFNLLPMLGTFNFNQAGSAVMAMYPKLPLYVYVFMRLIFRAPILSYYLGNAMMTFIGLTVSYYSFLTVKKTARVSALLFSLVYALSALNVSYQYLMADIGIVATVAFLPLAFTGLYHWVTEGKYRMLALGVTLVALSHVLSFVFLIVTFMIFSAINYGKLTDQKCLNLAKGVGLTVLLTSTFWVPALMFSMSTKIATPQIFSLGGTNVIAYTGDAILNNVSYGFTIAAVLGFVFGTVMYRHLASGLKQVYWVSLGYVVFSSSLFPWQLFQNTPLKVVQFTWRFLIFPQLGFCLIFCMTFVYFLSHLNKKKLIQLGVCGLGLVALGLSIDAQRKIVDFEIGSPEIDFKLSAAPENVMPYNGGRAWYKITNKYEYANLMKYISVYDYYPNKSVSKLATMTNRHMIQDGSHEFSADKVLGIPDGTETLFTLSRATQKVVLPTILYSLNYSVNVDNESVKTEKDSHNLTVLRHLSKGQHTVRVVFKGTGIKLVVSGLTLVGLVLMAWPEMASVYERRKQMVNEPLTVSK